ncbi:glycosyltransferase family 4 protein (plasmid) [Cetobacterium somerae]|uniref:glycosyltransferase family 4 protein n=1 Tax=Cetobacterium somerae TaxID=188913 RepID=UPI003D768E79
MKVLLDGRLISDKPTGISRYSRELVKIYQNHYGYENVEVIINEDLKEKPFKYIRTEFKPFSMANFFKFHRFLQRRDAEIYHTLYHSSSFFKDKKKKYITTFHDIGHKILKSKINDNFVKDILVKLGIEVIIRRTLKNSDIVVSVSETTKEDIKSVYNYNSIVIPEGINAISVEDKEVECLKNTKFFLYVGNSRPNKNLKFLIETFLTSNTEYKLVLVGNNNSLEINDSRIKSLGFVSDNELSWLYKNCEAFIFPSLYEGFGLPVLEAIYKGSKVYCSTGGSLKEFSEKLVKKFSPHNGSELRYLLENTDKIKFDEKEQLEELEKYTWKNIEILTKEKLFSKI